MLKKKSKTRKSNSRLLARYQLLHKLQDQGSSVQLVVAGNGEHRSQLLKINLILRERMVV
uniref:Uncharacterized protein n=1 Tax=Arundo donax TaxID=35708 RepID=A0A0A9CQF0_ARUDO